MLPVGIRISPSILAADFARLADEAARVEGAADWLHVDVMDNHFVPNLTLGLPVVEALLRVTQTPVDCHLMIDDPDRWAPAYAEAGAGSVTFHVEAAAEPVRLARSLRAAGARAGMGLKPGTSVEPYADLLPELDMLLVMTVEPGFGGQAFMVDMLAKVRRAKELIAGDRRRGVAAGRRRGLRRHDRAVAPRLAPTRSWRARPSTARRTPPRPAVSCGLPPLGRHRRLADLRPSPDVAQGHRQEDDHVQREEEDPRDPHEDDHPGHGEQECRRHDGAPPAVEGDRLPGKRN